MPSIFVRLSFQFSSLKCLAIATRLTITATPITPTPVYAEFQVCEDLLAATMDCMFQICFSQWAGEKCGTSLASCLIH